MEAQNIILGSVVAGFLAVFGYLLQQYVTSLKEKIRSLEEQDELQGDALVQIESDLNEIWYRFRKSQGVGGGKRRCRIAKRWRKANYVS
jgi:hypothetical protein